MMKVMTVKKQGDDSAKMVKVMRVKNDDGDDSEKNEDSKK